MSYTEKRNKTSVKVQENVSKLETTPIHNSRCCAFEHIERVGGGAVLVKFACQNMSPQGRERFCWENFIN